MDDETLETVKTLLESVLEDTDGSEVHYKLRTALQLLVVHESRLDQLETPPSRLEDAVQPAPNVDTDADDADGLEARLRALGYLD